ncbi:phthiocerol/phenolphthiocerol synthesis type-I polyketide synthase E [Catenulispora sp. EB89]|uniref:SDR family NAD(P)-dependent oxidoreductase n=1 Tax=Catenulispora sp. EB89 TaxID=3156257 RepID=UPI003512D383
MTVSRGTEIAVVGMAGEFPAASTVDELWSRLKEGEECLSRFSEEQLVAAGGDRVRIRSTGYVAARGTLEHAEDFDAAFFGIAPSEAAVMDPQQRRFLHVVWSALEHAGYSVAGAQRVGVFAGAGTNTHVSRLAVPTDPDSDEAWRVSLWNDNDFLATRAAYKLNLTGPAMTVQSACSTSLLSVILAAQSLLAGDCDLAVAGGAAVKTPQVRGYIYTSGGILSPDGRCRPFDRRSGGTVPGNGVAAVVLKRLDDAVADRDTIHAVMRGYGFNNDGSEKVSYSAPSAVGQAGAVGDAHRTAELKASEVGYIEAHGTGTALGDAIEIAALRQVFAGVDNLVRLGSVKGNVGHLDIAAGITGFIKTCLMVRDGLFVPTMHFEEANAELRLDESPFEICRKLEKWETAGLRIAGVSSFGIGGTNTHVVVEEPPVRSAPDSAHVPEVIMLSGASAEAVDRRRRQLADHLAASGTTGLADVAFTLARGRRPMEYRSAFAAGSVEQLISELGVSGGTRRSGAELPVVFMFPGGGTLHAGAATALMASEPIFRQRLEECVAAYSEHTRASVRRFLVDQVRDAVPFSITLQAIFAFEYALSEALLARGVRPAALIGHSLGEYSAALAAGVFDLRTAAAAVEARSQVLDRADGTMLSVALPASAVAAVLPAGLSIAAINTDDFTVVSGSHQDIDAFERKLQVQQVEVRRVPIAAAAHSALLDPGLPGFRSHMASTSFHRPKTPLISNLTGDWADAAQFTDPDYWVRQLREPVNFAAGIRTALSLEPTPILVEVGPGHDLSSLVSRAKGSREGVVTVCPPDRDDSRLVALAVARVWEYGATIHGIEDRTTPRGRVPLPTYPFANDRQPSAGAEPPRARPLDDWFYAPVWRPSVSPLSLSAGAAGRILLAGLSDPGDLAALLGLADHEVTVAHRMPGGHWVGMPEDPAWRPTTVVFGVDDEPCGDPVEGEADRAAGFLELVRRFDGDSASRIRFVIVGNGLHEVNGGDCVCPERRQLAGLCISLAQELEWFDWIILDPGSDPANAADPGTLVAEISADSTDRVVAYRGAHRFVRNFVQVGLRSEPGPRVPAAGKTYLLTGGLGRIGQLLVSHLIDKVGANVVLLSRRRPEDTPPYTRDAAAVRHVSGDVSRVEDVRRAVEEAKRSFGRLDGVFHLAAVTRGRSVPRRGSATDREDLLEQLLPKVGGARALAEVLAGTELDFCVLFSSNAGVLGGLGLGAYAAANAVLDGFSSEAGRRTATRWVTVSWDGWPGVGATSFRDGGRSSLDAFELSAEEAIEAMGRVLAAEGLSWIVVSRGSFEDRQRLWVAERGLARPGHVDQARSRVSSDSEDEAGRNPAIPDGERIDDESRDGIERVLCRLWSEVLGIEATPRTDFFNQGGHSLLGVRLLRRIEEETGVALPPYVIAHAPTPGRLAPLVAAPGSVALVELAARSGPPLILIHPQGGGVLSYAPLADALGDISVLACDDNRLTVQDPSTSSVEELAARHVRTIKQAAVKGPYRIGGWSFGGVVAYEVARQLRSEGEQVRLLLIDSPAPTGDLFPISTEEDLMSTLIWNWLRQAGVYPAHSYSEFLSLAPEERDKAARDAAAAAGMHSLVRALDDAQGDGILRRTVSVAAAHGAELNAYRPDSSDIEALLVRATRQHDGPLAAVRDHETDLGWGSLLQSLTVISADGDHASILARPEVRTVALAVRRWLL